VLMDSPTYPLVSVVRPLNENLPMHKTHSRRLKRRKPRKIIYHRHIAALKGGKINGKIESLDVIDSPFHSVDCCESKKSVFLFLFRQLNVLVIADNFFSLARRRRRLSWMRKMRNRPQWPFRFILQTSCPCPWLLLSSTSSLPLNINFKLHEPNPRHNMPRDATVFVSRRAENLIFHPRLSHCCAKGR
jgi:hypothetical protein